MMHGSRNERQPRPWLAWAREIQAIGQTGMAYSAGEYDRQRYRRLLEIAAEIVAGHTACAREPLVADFLMQAGYATPKVDVRGATVRDGRLLLVQERSDQRWCLPGGWADVGAAPAEMVAREVREESGFEVQPQHIIGVYDANRNQSPLEFYHAYKIVFLCDIVSGEARPSDETMAVDFFDFDALPPLSSNRTSERDLRDVWAALQNGSQTTIFD
jgi:ADP-ribose pyrophosphatase YjhB (NUDIX family)